MSENKNNSCESCDFIGLFLIFWGIPSLIGFILGTMEANSNYGSCDKTMTKIEYVYPAYRAGCYLNKRGE